LPESKNYNNKGREINSSKQTKISQITFVANCKKIIKTINEFGTTVSDHNLFILAGGIAFNVLLYIIPLILIFVYFINIFIETDDLIQIIRDALLNYLPHTDLYSSFIANVVIEIQRIAASAKIAGIVGFVILLWISSTVISALNTCISMIFNVEQPHYFRTKLKDLGTTILLNILILIYCFLIPIVSISNSVIDNIFPNFLSGYISQATIITTQLVVSFLLFYFIYWIIPSNKTKTHHKTAIQATVIAVLATELARIIFTLYISTVTTYTRFYGTYAVIVTMAVWLYYSCFIILFSAELAQFIGIRRQAKLNPVVENEQLFPSSEPIKSTNSKVNHKKHNRNRLKKNKN